MRDDDKPAAASAHEIVKALPGTSLLAGNPASSSILGSTIDRLIVLSDVDDVDKGSYAFAPMQMDRGKLGSTLADWFLLPFASPEQIILPGFHSAGIRSSGAAPARKSSPASAACCPPAAA